MLARVGKLIKELELLINVSEFELQGVTSIKEVLLFKDDKENIVLINGVNFIIIN